MCLAVQFEGYIYFWNGLFEIDVSETPGYLKNAGSGYH